MHLINNDEFDVMIAKKKETEIITIAKSLRWSEEEYGSGAG